MLERPPKWQDSLNIEIIQKGIESEEIQAVLRKAQEHYVYWDKFKYYPLPQGFSPEDAWMLLKFTQRSTQEMTPVRDTKGLSFRFSLTKSLYKKLNYIDIHTAGFIRTLAKKPDDSQSEKLLISGLSEEAIASSQIEGASTTRKVAKEMLLSGRKPKNESEQMIINNYQAMKRLDELKEFELSEELLKEIQSIITNKTLSDDERGRFRCEGEDIVVHDALTGEIAHTPVSYENIQEELRRLIDYANRSESENDFVHPVVKATVLHFWLSYIHPFVDGNGRTARAIFYWYLMKNDYWLFQYLSVSRIIKKNRKNYDLAFLYTENDDNDLTYFLIYIVDSVCKAIEEMKEYYEEQIRKESKYKALAKQLKGLNERQVALITYLLKHPEDEVEIQIHQRKHGVAYETARQDLISLVEKGYLAETVRGKKSVFLANITKMKKLRL